jgi:hypothetical protein
MPTRTAPPARRAAEISSRGYLNEQAFEVTILSFDQQASAGPVQQAQQQQTQQQQSAEPCSTPCVRSESSG